MTSDMRSTDRLAIEMSECKSMGIDVLGPDINQSYADFAIVGGENKIRFGLAAIKGMGKALVEDIVIPERDKNGPFQSVCDFAKRVDSTKFNKKSWESAIKTGAFDRFGTRSDLLFNLEQIQAYGSKMQKDSANGQTDLFGMMGDIGQVPEPEMKPAPKQASDKEQLLWERNLMGLYLSAHPLDKYEKYFEEQTHPFSYINQEHDNKRITLGGIVTSVKIIMTKAKNEKMAFITLESKSGSAEILIFPKLYNDNADKIVMDAILKIPGRISATDQSGNPTSDIKTIAEDVFVISDEVLESYEPTGIRLDEPEDAPKRRQFKKKPESEQPEPKPKPVALPPLATEKPLDPRSQKLYILIENPEDTERLTGIKTTCDLFPGLTSVVLVLKDGAEKKVVTMSFKVEASSQLIDQLKAIVGEKAVVLK